MRRASVWGWGTALITLVIGFLGNAFVRQGGLGTFADDSVSYLVMGQIFTPWRETPAAVASVFHLEAFHPPLYPMLLALTGAAYDFALAHTLSAVLVAACLPLCYALAVRWLDDRRAAFAVAAAVALLPAIWIHMRGILSEPLFCSLLLGALWVIDAPWAQRRRLVALAILFSALALTRTVGLVVAAAYAAWALSRRGRPVQERLLEALPAAAAGSVHGLWLLVRPAGIADINAGLATDRLAVLKGASQPLAAFGEGLLRQAHAMSDAWAGSVLLFWVEGQPMRPILAAVLGLLALAGLVHRFVRGRPDAWICAAYLVVYLLWPFYDQMTRFLFPIIPVLVLYAFMALGEAARRLGRGPTPAAALLALLIASLAAPGLAFMYQRFRMPGPETAIIDWYRTPDLALARERARVHLGLAADMVAIRAMTTTQDRVMWVAPAYVALLADRRGLPAPPSRLAASEYRAAVLRMAPDFVFLSTFHPRDTIRDDAFRAGFAALLGAGTVVHGRSVSARPASVLIQLRP